MADQQLRKLPAWPATDPAKVMQPISKQTSAAFLRLHGVGLETKLSCLLNCQEPALQCKDCDNNIHVTTSKQQVCSTKIKTL